ncbi:MAG: hypothetical protein JW809_00655 [Pirellulales bacterium]|nr:hypothetical protein [Pirellulales bacterium]
MSQVEFASSRLAPAEPDVIPALTAPNAEAAALWQLRRRMIRTHLRQILSHSRLRLSLIVVLSALLWAGMFWLFADGFQFLESAISHVPTLHRTVGAVFSIFFAALLVMLVFSSAILIYSGLFWAKDAPLLLALPVRTQRVFLHKFQEALFFSSWAFFLLSSPMLLAYGVTKSAPWYYFASLPAFLLAFTYVPAAMGAIACVVVVRWAPRGRYHVLVAAVAVLVGAAAWLGWTVLTGPDGALFTPAWFRQILARMQFSQQSLLPSWWLSSGLLDAADRNWSESTLYLSLLIANALLLRQTAIWMAGRAYRAAYDRLQGRHVPRRAARPVWIDRALMRLVPLPLSVRLLLVKDLRLFRRDPVQWSQFLVFFGLLALYFLNIRRFGSNARQIAWVNMISFLNLSVVGLILSTLTTRFIFPMISLEGRRFWMLGLLPVRRETILWSKFLFAVGGSLLPCCVLVFFSDAMLGVPGFIQASHQSTCILLCLGLSGMAVGLGARMPNFRESSPSRIAAGFGGTLNLVASALYILTIVALTALPSHFYLLARHSLAGGFLAERPGVLWWLDFWLVAGIAASVVLGLATTILPLMLGIRALRRMEF